MQRALTITTSFLLLMGCYPDRTCTDCAGDGTTDTEVDTSASDDSDGDTITDEEEGFGRDTDGDTIPDYLDEDSDNDGWPDALEAGDDDLTTSPRDSDSDGTPDYLDEDSDGNGIDDADETDGDVDGDGRLDPFDTDDDDDLCIDPREGSATHRDTDGDTIDDHQDEDSDGDTISDLDEGCLDDCDGDLVPNRVDEDSDDNGIPDAEEGAGNTDETTDTGPDDEPDWCDSDNDGDGITDVDELEVYGTDPMEWDTDGDGDFDYLEVVIGTDPLDGEDSVPADLLVVGPLDTPVYITATTSLPRVDLTILAGTGGDLADETADLQADLPGAVTTLEALVEELEVAVLAYEDFGSVGYGPEEAVPLSVMTHATSEPSVLADALSDLEARSSLMDGSIDVRASGVEAIYQLLTGMGMGDLIDHATCASSPLDPARFGAACMREDAYSIIAVFSDRLSWSPQGCLSIDTTCTYDPELFPEDVTLHRYPQTISWAQDLGVRILGVTPDPSTTLETDHTAWIRRFGLDTSTVSGGGDVVMVDVGTSADRTTEMLADAVTELLTTSPFDATVQVVDLPDEDPQPEGRVLGYGLGAYPMSCDPATGDWGTCILSGSQVQNVGPGVELSIQLVYTPPGVHPRVDVLAFEVRLAVEGRMIVHSQTGYLVVPESWDPDL